jgi:hypothetical protein
MESGDVEIEAISCKILNRSKNPLPLPVVEVVRKRRGGGRGVSMFVVVFDIIFIIITIVRKENLRVKKFD